MKMRTLIITVGLVVVAGALAIAQTKDAMQVVNPTDFQWKPKDALPPGAFSAPLNGDVHTGPYDFIAKFPASYTVPMHTHSNDVKVVMLKGAMTIGREKMPPVTIQEDGFFLLPGKMMYTAHCDRECTFLAHGEKAFDLIYQNPKDDPRNKKGAVSAKH